MMNEDLQLSIGGLFESHFNGNLLMRQAVK